MQVLLRCLLLLATAVPFAAQEQKHSRWHPEDAHLFIEVHDVASAVSIYERAPLLRLMNDPEVAKLLGAVGGPGGSGEAGLTIPSLFDWVGQRLGVQIPGAVLREGLGTFSISLRHDGEDLGLTAILDTQSIELATKLSEALRQLAATTRDNGLLGFEVLEGGKLPAPMWLSIQDSTLVFGLSDATAQGFHQRKSGNEKSSLQQNKNLQQGLQAIGHGPGEAMLFGTYSGDLPFAQLGFSDLGPLEGFLRSPKTFSMRFNNQRFEMRLFTADPSAKKDRPLDQAWVADLPSDAMLTYASRIDMPGLVEQFQTEIEALPVLLGQGTGFDSGELAEMTGLMSDLLSGLGPRFRLSVQPIVGPALPATLCWVDCSDPEGFRTRFEQIGNKLGEMLPGVSVRTRDYRVKNKETGERTSFQYTTLNIPTDQLPGLLSLIVPKLSFTAFENELLFSLSNTVLKSELKRLYRGPKPEPRNLFADHGIRMAENSQSLFVFNWPEMLSKLLGVAKLLGGAVASNIGFDMANLPSYEVPGRYLKATVHQHRVTDQGVIREHVSSFGPLSWLGILGGALYLGVGQMIPAQAMPVTPQRNVRAKEGSAQREQEADSQVESTESALKDLKSAIAIFEIDRGEVPDGLLGLVETNERYPKGYLSEPELPRDGWGRTFLYKKLGPKSYRLWSFGANGKNENGEGDDVLP